jgi:hypothetical protein
MPMPRVFAFVVRELEEMIPPTLFFAVGFNLIVLTTQLFLDDYRQQFVGFMVATTTALVVGKAVLLANALPFLRRFDRAPLIQPILFKTAVYFAVVFLVRVLEKIVEYLIDGGTLAGIPEYLREHFSWHRFAAVQIWIAVLFMVYTTAAELNSLFGDGELARVFFTRHTSDLKLTRRQRIRTLVKLSHLTQAHTLDELRDRSTAAHADLFGLIGGLATPQGTSRISAGRRQRT